MTVAVWLGSAPPVRSVRWLDGAIAAATKFGKATAIAAGEQSWLDLAADRATRGKLACFGLPTELRLDYLGWAQVVVAIMNSLKVTTLLVDEASRPERFVEVAAIAELLDAAHLTHVVSIAVDGPVVHASRSAGREVQSVRVRGPAVIGVRIAGPPVDEFPTPMPSATLRRLELASLGLDPVALAHRALPPRTTTTPKKSAEKIADHLTVHLAPRSS